MVSSHGAWQSLDRQSLGTANLISKVAHLYLYRVSQAWPGLVLCELEIICCVNQIKYLNKKFRESVHFNYNLSANYPLFIHQKNL